MLFIRLITLLALVAGVSSVRVIGWWVGSINDPTFPIEQFPWEMYTHFRHGQPITFENGTAYCNKTDYAFQRILKKAHHHNVDGACLWQGRQDLNPRPIALKATILPTELLPLICHTGSSSFVVVHCTLH